MLPVSFAIAPGSVSYVRYAPDALGGLAAIQIGHSLTLVTKRVLLSAMSPNKATLDQLRIDRTRPEPPRRNAGIIMAVAGLIAVAAAIVWWLTRPQPLEVQTATAREIAGGDSGSRTVLNASGYVVARREATVSSKVTGKVVQVLVEEGMHVEEEQVLARLDDSNVKVNLALAEAQLDAARTGLGETQARLDEAELELGRVTELAKDNVASPAELDRARAEAKSFQARLATQQVEISVADRQVGLWQQQLDDLIIRAPFAGVVTSKNAQPGEMISPISAGGGFTRTGICTIVDMSSLEIEVDVNESYINRVEPQQPVEAALDAYSDWKIPCTVIATVPTADRQKATVKVRVGFNKLDPRILPQMRVKVAFRAAEEPSGDARIIVIPENALRELPDGRNVVWVLKRDRAERRAVRVASRHQDEAAVAAGLAAGEKVIVDPPAGLTETMRVKEKKL